MLNSLNVALRLVLQIKAVLEGKPLPPPSAKFTQAWEDAKREALKSEYVFKPGLNVFNM